MVGAVLITAADVVAVWPLIKPKATTHGAVSETETNIASYHDQLDDLQWQMQQGLLSTDVASSLRIELQKKLSGELVSKQSSNACSLLKKPGFALLIAVLIPVSSVLLYFQLGATTELAVLRAMNNGDLNSEQSEALLQAWAAKRPANHQALFLLASHHLNTGKFDEAITTLRQLVEVSKGHPQAAAELAQVLFLTNKNTITPEIRQLYRQALTKDSDNTTALGLRGIDAFAAGQYQTATDVWLQALKSEPDPVVRQSLVVGISKARTLLGKPGVAVRVHVKFAPGLGPIPADAKVVVFARPTDAPDQPPVVAVPLQAGDLPQEVVLDDSHAMIMGTQLLSAIDRLDIYGRISLSGNLAMPDYQVRLNGVKTTSAEPVTLTFH